MTALKGMFLSDCIGFYRQLFCLQIKQQNKAIILHQEKEKGEDYSSP